MAHAELDNQSTKSVVGDALLAIALAVGTILSRWPFQTTILESFDAVNYALALDHYDMRLGQPQAPGYPLYIILGRAFDFFLHDHLAALLGVSIVFSGLGVAAVYLAGQEMFSRRAGVIAALLLATSTLYWYLSEVAAPYTADLFASAIVGWLCYRLKNSMDQTLIWIGALAVGLAGGLRPQTLFFLFPLFLYAAHKRPWKEIISALLLASVMFFACFWPSVMASGGYSSFLKSMKHTVPIFQSTQTLIRATQWSRFAGNAYTTIRYAFAALGELGCIFALLGYLTRPHRLRFWRNPQLLFLAIWIAPTWIVYLLIWPGNIGTILVCTPPLFLLAAAGLDWLMSRPKWGLAVGTCILTIALVWQIVAFTVLPHHPFGQAYRRFDNYEKLKENVGYVQNKLSLLSEIPAERTIVYAQLFRHPQYYLPEYHTFSMPTLRKYNPNIVESIVSIENGQMTYWNNVDVSTLTPIGTKRIVLFDLSPESVQADRSQVEERWKDSFGIVTIAISIDHQVLWTQDGLRVEKR